MASEHAASVTRARFTDGAHRLTLPELVAGWAAIDPTGVYLESARDERAVSWAELARSAAAWSHRLDRAGVPAGGRVSLSVADPLRFATAFVSIIAADRVVAPLDAGAGPAALARHRATIGSAATVRVDADAAPATVATARLDDSWAVVRASDAGLRPAERDRALPEGGGLLLASSGTTGPPKLVELTEAQLVHTATEIAACHGLDRRDRGFNPLPLWHVNAEVVGLLATLVAGAQLVLDDRFHRTGFWKLMADREISWLNAVPAVLAILAQQRPEPAAPPSLRFARSASAPLPAATLHAFERVTGVLVVETYGMTEAGSQITANPVGPDRRPGSVGRPVGVSLQIVDDEAAQVPAGTLGRVRIRGAGVITRYAGPAGNDRIDRDGWLDTGDLGRLDDDGYLLLAGRRDDIINRGGEKLVPTEIEDVLAEDPGVAAVVVLGWPDPVLGAVPVAAIVPAVVPAGTASAAAPEAVPGSTSGSGSGAGPGDAAGQQLVKRLRRRAADRLDRPYRPAAYHLLERLPAGVNGKVSRRAVREAVVELAGSGPVPPDDSL